jgi:hypothetical protein
MSFLAYFTGGSENWEDRIVLEGVLVPSSYQLERKREWGVGVEGLFWSEESGMSGSGQAWRFSEEIRRHGVYRKTPQGSWKRPRPAFTTSQASPCLINSCVDVVLVFLCSTSSRAKRVSFSILTLFVLWVGCAFPVQSGYRFACFKCYSKFQKRYLLIFWYLSFFDRFLEKTCRTQAEEYIKTDSFVNTISPAVQVLLSFEIGGERKDGSWVI